MTSRCGVTRCPTRRRRSAKPRVLIGSSVPFMPFRSRLMRIPSLLTISGANVSRDTTACRTSSLLTPSRNPHSIPEYGYANFRICIELKYSCRALCGISSSLSRREPTDMADPGILSLAGLGIALGLRHGIDWDHLAAITDITSATMTTDETTRESADSLSSLPRATALAPQAGTLAIAAAPRLRSEEHTSELQSRLHL